MPLLEFFLDVEDEIVFRALPVRSDQQSKWGLAEHALDDNPGIEPLYEVTQEIKVLFVLEDPKRPSRVFGRERGTAYEMQVMNFQRVNAHARHLVGHCQPLLACLPWKSKN